ncbi:1254_t:CDS:2, partial [Scutellospora calospora]
KGDEEDYINLLKTSLINDTKQSFPQDLLGKKFSNETFKEFKDVVNSVIKDLVINEESNSYRKMPPNVLSLGFKKVITKDFNYGAMVEYENSCTDYIRRLPALKSFIL